MLCRRRLRQACGGTRLLHVCGGAPGDAEAHPHAGAVRRPRQQRPPHRAPSDHQSTWAAGDKSTKALSEALRQRLSTSKEEGGPQPRPDSPRAPADIKGVTEFDTVVSCAPSPCQRMKNSGHCEAGWRLRVCIEQRQTLGA